MGELFVGERRLENDHLTSGRREPVMRPEAVPLAAIVLLVDDRPTALDALAPVLARSGRRTLTAASGGAALDLFIREPADLLIVNQTIVEMDGGELLRRVRALDGDVPIIMQGGVLDAQQRRSMMRDLDLHGIHNRDGHVDRLLELVESALAGRRRVASARAAQEVRDLMLAKFCHDLRSCLHVIRGYTEMLRDDPAMAPVETILAPLGVASDTALGLAQDYLDLARLDAPGVIVRRELVDVDALLADLRVLGGRQIGDRPLRLTTRVPFAGGYLYTDGEKLRAILAQLLANAVKFCPSGEIRLTVRLQPGRTDFVLADTGPGFNEADVPGAFSPFCQLTAETVASTPGQGVGLAIALRLSALIGASLMVNPGKQSGAMFTVRLPGTISLRHEVFKPTLH